MKIKRFENYTSAPAKTGTQVDDLTSFFIKTMFDVAKNSVARRLQVGSVVIKNNNIVGIGFNHTPFNQDQNCQIELPDGSLKSKPWVHFADSDKEGVIHAETDALRRMYESGVSPVGCTMYVTHSCCLDCAKLVAESGIKKVYYGEAFHDTSGLDYLNAHGVQTEQIS
jgi:dCMP deaminase